MTRRLLRAPDTLSWGGAAMERLLERCAGLDVHKKTVAVCVRVPGTHGDRVQHVRTFGTTASRTWPWRAPACTGAPSPTSSRRRSPVFWPTPPRSPRCPAAKPTSRTASGSLSCSSTGSSARASCPRPLSASSGISRATARCPHSGTHPQRQPLAQGPGGCGHQAHLGRHAPARRLRPRDARRPPGGHDRSGDLGRARRG